MEKGKTKDFEESKEDIYDVEITPEVIEENIKNVKEGKPLTVPLKQLGTEFKERLGVVEE